MTRQPVRQPIPWSYRAVIGTVRPVLMGITRRSWSGAEHVPATGGFIVASNHYSEVDPFMLAHFLVDQGRPPFFLAKSSLFEVPLLGAALRAGVEEFDGILVLLEDLGGDPHRMFG